MSTKIECTTCADVTIGLDRADPNRTTGEFYIFMGEEGHYVLRTAFLAAVEAECRVRIVPADAIVIERAELPEVEVREWREYIAGSLHVDGPIPAVDARQAGREWLALAEYLDAHPATPPVDEADVRALTGLLDTLELGPVEWTSQVADLLLRTGRVSVTR